MSNYEDTNVQFEMVVFGAQFIAVCTLTIVKFFTSLNFGSVPINDMQGACVWIEEVRIE